MRIRFKQQTGSKLIAVQNLAVHVDADIVTLDPPPFERRTLQLTNVVSFAEGDRFASLRVPASSQTILEVSLCDVPYIVSRELLVHGGALELGGFAVVALHV